MWLHSLQGMATPLVATKTDKRSGIIANAVALQRQAEAEGQPPPEKRFKVSVPSRRPYLHTLLCLRCTSTVLASGHLQKRHCQTDREGHSKGCAAGRLFPSWPGKPPTLSCSPLFIPALTVQGPPNKHLYNVCCIFGAQRYHTIMLDSPTEVAPPVSQGSQGYASCRLDLGPVHTRALE